jgi:ribonuclease BN (tRNA processing enzyme)
LRHGGNTSCVEIRTKKHIIILDAGTGIINLGSQLLKEKTDGNNETRVLTVLISHTHHDHIQGLPFFVPAYQNDYLLQFYGPKSLSENFDQILSKSMSPQYSPVEFEELRSQIEIKNITDNYILVLGDNSSKAEIVTQTNLKNNGKQKVVIRIMRSYGHPKVGVFIFKIEVNGKSVVYATDTEGYVGGDTRLVDFAKNANLLIHDAQYTPEEYLNYGFPKQGFGHSTYEMAAQVAQKAGVENLVLFHHDPAHDDDQLAEMEAKANALFPNSKAGAEGLEFTF